MTQEHNSDSYQNKNYQSQPTQVFDTPLAHAPQEQQPLKTQWNPKQSWHSFNGGIGSLQHWFNSHFSYLATHTNDFYEHTPVRMADFKRNYILTMGDERIRLIILSVLSIPIWKISNYRSTNAPLLRYRNLALTFVGLGLILSPEIFNPFLHDHRNAGIPNDYANAIHHDKQ